MPKSHILCTQVLYEPFWQLTLWVPLSSLLDSARTPASVPLSSLLDKRGAHFQRRIFNSVCALCCSYLYSWKDLFISFTMTSASRGVAIIFFWLIASRSLSKFLKVFLQFCRHERAVCSQISWIPCWFGFLEGFLVVWRCLGVKTSENVCFRDVRRHDDESSPRETVQRARPTGPGRVQAVGNGSGSHCARSRWSFTGNARLYVRGGIVQVNLLRTRNPLVFGGKTWSGYQMKDNFLH